jgi:formylglycine-generating enzyme required for sulfatase activity
MGTIKLTPQGMDIVRGRYMNLMLTQEQLANKAIVSTSTIRRLMSGKPIRVRTFEGVCKALDLDPWEVLNASPALERTMSFSSRSFVVRRVRRTTQGFVEPLLEVGDALPLQMVLVPGGTFLMGSPEDEPEREEGEGPQHKATVRSFFMGRYPITQAQWRAVAALPQVKQELAPDPSKFKGDNRPVERVSWFDAEEFCLRLAQYTDRTYRLPTEAEWEYACRAGTTTPFYFGKTLTTELANYDGSSYAGGPEGKSPGETTPVNHFDIANAFGLSDMHGNVDEWCQDHWYENYVGAPTDGSAWIEGGDSEVRVLRGGSWIDGPRSCRSAYRDNFTPVNRNYDIGFRVCCSAPRALQ